MRQIIHPLGLSWSWGPAVAGPRRKPLDKTSKRGWHDQRLETRPFSQKMQQRRASRGAKPLATPENARTASAAAGRSGRAECVRGRERTRHSGSTSCDSSGAQPRGSPEPPRIFTPDACRHGSQASLRETPAAAFLSPLDVRSKHGAVPRSWKSAGAIPSREFVTRDP